MATSCWVVWFWLSFHLVPCARRTDKTHQVCDNASSSRPQVLFSVANGTKQGCCLIYKPITIHCSVSVQKIKMQHCLSSHATATVMRVLFYLTLPIFLLLCLYRTICYLSTFQKIKYLTPNSHNILLCEFYPLPVNERT